MIAALVGPLLAAALAAPPRAEPRQAAEAAATTADPLEALFSAAEAKPDAVVPLILEASRALAVLDGDAGHELATRLEPFARRAFFGPERLPGMERVGLVLHEVAKGELPAKIAARYGVGAGLFPRWNEGYDERRLGVGQRLKLLDLSREGSLRLIVDRERHRLSAWHALSTGEWVLLAYLPVGLGAPETPTPSGSTRITLRALDPEWTDPVTGRVFAPRDPGNLLGGYWMALAAEGLGGRTGIGLHGYTGEASAEWLEKDRSNGCVRLLQGDIDRIFHLALEGTPVELVP
jgi:lipoprotein-anchoring transpeptidase ErfK/SrfK